MKQAIDESNSALNLEKIWNTHHSKEMVGKCLKTTLDNLELEYVDSLLLHWPFCFAEDTDEAFPLDSNGKVRFSDIHYLETYKRMEELCKEGKAKSIGLSNFIIEQVDDVSRNYDCDSI